MPKTKNTSHLALLIEIRTEPSGARMTDDDARRGMILNVSDRGARKSAVTAAPRVTGEFQSVVLGANSTQWLRGALLGACALAACAHRDQPVPVSGAAKAASALQSETGESAGVRMIARARAWNGNPPTLSQYVFPVWVEVENTSHEPRRLSITSSSFSRLGGLASASSQKIGQVSVVQAPAMRGATRAYTRRMQPRSNEAGRDAWTAQT
jgi:hypothetical protein